MYAAKVCAEYQLPLLQQKILAEYVPTNSPEVISNHNRPRISHRDSHQRSSASFPG